MENIENPFKYAGEMYDEESGMYYLRARYYDPRVGRFISEDTNEGQVDNPLSLNLYTYCLENPLRYTDTSGNVPIPVILCYMVSVANSPDTQMDMQLIALDISQGNYFAAALDAAGALIPGATGLGKAGDDLANKLLKIFARKLGRDITVVKAAIGNGKVIMGYKYLKQLAKGTGLEVHHLIEKRFAAKLGIKADEIMSVDIDKNLHKEITAAIRKEIGYALDINNIKRTTNATAQDIWNALKNVYTEKGLTNYLDAIRPVFKKLGVNVK